MNKKELKKSLEEIFEQIKDPLYRWDGLIALKQLDVENYKDLLVYTKHPFWLISWAILDKIADFKEEKSIPHLFPLIKHIDPQIKQKAQDVIIDLSSNNVLYFIKKLDHFDYRVRYFSSMVIKEKGPNIVSFLSKHVGKHSWVISNKLIHIIWDILGPTKAHTLSRFLSNQSVRRHTIMLMALSKNKHCIEPILKLYKHPRLKQHILLAIQSFGINNAVPIIIDLLKDSKMRLLAKSVIKRIGSPCVPHLIKASISKDEHFKDIMGLLEIIPFTMNQYITLEDKYLAKKSLLKHLEPVTRYKPN
tara:strand:+ start:2029 stop:2940 length:912 start_codon:yes stop_codon:yes gene_type:complete